MSKDNREWRCQFFGRVDTHYYDFNLFRHPYHDLTISFDSEADSWEGILRVSSVDDGPQGDLGEYNELPECLVAKLVRSFNLKDIVLEYMNDV